MHGSFRQQKNVAVRKLVKAAAQRGKNWKPRHRQGRRAGWPTEKADKTSSCLLPTARWCPTECRCCTSTEWGCTPMAKSSHAQAPLCDLCQHRAWPQTCSSLSSLLPSPSMGPGRDPRPVDRQRRAAGRGRRTPWGSGRGCEVRDASGTAAAEAAGGERLHRGPSPAPPPGRASPAGPSCSPAPGHGRTSGRCPRGEVRRAGPAGAGRVTAADAGQPPAGSRRKCRRGGQGGGQAPRRGTSPPRGRELRLAPPPPRPGRGRAAGQR